MDWVGGWVEEEGPAGDTQVSGLSTWWVTMPFPEMGNLQTADGKGRCRDPVWGTGHARFEKSADCRENAWTLLQRPWPSWAIDQSRQLVLLSLTKSEE